LERKKNSFLGLGGMPVRVRRRRRSERGVCSFVARRFERRSSFDFLLQILLFGFSLVRNPVEKVNGVELESEKPEESYEG